MKKKVFASILIAILLLLSACSQTKSESENLPELPYAQELQNALADGLEQYGGKGISVAVIVPGYRPWVGVSGISHETTPITPETIFDAGSIHKFFTAAVIMQLAEEGVLSLDDPLSKWLPSYPHIGNTITIRQLLNHTSGIFDMVRHPDYWEAMSADVMRIWEPGEILNNFMLEPYFQKGKGWHYSTPGYILLRMIIEEATGKDLVAVYRNILWENHNLENTYLAIYEELPENTAHGWFDLDGDGTYEEISNFKSFNSSTHGAIFTTAEDLAMWTQDYFHAKTVVNQESLEQALAFQPTSPEEPLTKGYGLGVVQFSPEIFNNIEILGHSGNAAGYAAGCFYLPEYEISIGIMVNTHAGETMPTVFDILNILTMDAE